MKALLLMPALLAVLTYAQPVIADDAHHKSATKVAQASAPLTDGEVRKVDKEAKKITLRHGPIENLDMPAMSMVFQVKDPAMLDEVKAGDRVRFLADKVNGQYFVTRIEAVR